jgi:hypothetical protein
MTFGAREITLMFEKPSLPSDNEWMRDAGERCVRGDVCRGGAARCAKRKKKTGEDRRGPESGEGSSGHASGKRVADAVISLFVDDAFDLRLGNLAVRSLVVPLVVAVLPTLALGRLIFIVRRADTAMFLLGFTGR